MNKWHGLDPFGKYNSKFCGDKSQEQQAFVRDQKKLLPAALGKWTQRFMADWHEALCMKSPPPITAASLLLWDFCLH
jgi:hypothetical protein